MSLLWLINIFMKYIFLGLFMLATSAAAFEPLNTDDAGTVVACGNQIEQYYFLINRSGGSQSSDIITPGEEYSGSTDARAFPFTYTRGLSDTVEASFSTTYYTQPNGNFSRFANYVFATKWRFQEDLANRYALAIKPIVILPAKQQQQVAGLGLAAFNYGFNFIGSKYWDEIEIHANASYLCSPYNTNYSIGRTADSSRTDIFLLSIAPVFSIASGMRLALDVGATTNPANDEQYLSFYSLVGVIYSLTQSVDIATSYMRTALNYSATIGAASAGSSRAEIGFTWRF
ncbi:hypothetical protein [Polynucleobacter sp. MWH-Berg-3C6]|uniref:hypothetical protein n=1 Tax=Polynucleobacter sp. MWH-Berg-3C6 TaxID=1855882 RepID=UPI001C0C265A|nr:hypothetical protein [Polynucleobacter sp. MWH-Berg-3C6]MBU3550605.1 hypothetical protein [Polynucleobacter sp. MWH-Berg-3C6]